VPARTACAAMVAAWSIVQGGFGAVGVDEDESVDMRFEDVEVRLLAVEDAAGGSVIVKKKSCSWPRN
jgi:hypothetical protein